MLEKCPEDRDCNTCPLHAECGGVLKTKGNGFVSIDDAIDKKARVSKETWEAEMLCERPSTRGVVFPTFDPAVHVREVGPLVTMTLAIDFGFRAPFVCLWIADDGTNVHVIDEHVQAGMTVEKHLKLIAEREWGGVKHVACDPAGRAKNEQTGESNVRLMRKAGYTVASTPSYITEGLEQIRAGLQTGDGRATLFIHPRCVNLIKAMQGYHYPEAGQSEKPEKDGEFDHAVDALRYFYINRMKKEQSRATEVRY